MASGASGQWGYLRTDQLLAYGMSSAEVTARRRAGTLITRHRGVHALGHRPRARESDWAAALLACGPTAVLSHFAAAKLHGFLDLDLGDVHVTVTKHRRGHRGIALHLSRTLEGQTMKRRGFPVTNPYRTLLDLADLLDADALHKAAMEAEFQGHVDLQKLKRLPGRGSASLDALFDRIEEGSRSKLEARFIKLCRDAGLPTPKVNATVGPYRPDFLWPEQRVIVETDGYDAHRGRRAFERDRQRIAVFWQRGYDVLPTTWNHVRFRPALVTGALRTKLV